MTQKIKGDIVECGIGRGRSLIAICHIINEWKQGKKVHAFDSFEGFGFINPQDRSFRDPKNGEWSHSPNEKIRHNKKFISRILELHIYEKNFKNVELVKGFVENTLPKHANKIKKISFLNADVDLYSGHTAILENLWTKISKNGIIYFDDIYHKKVKKVPFPGARKAYDYFFAGKRKYIKELICEKRGNLIVQKII